MLARGPDYRSLNTTMGSTRLAWRAGMSEASEVTIRTAAVMSPNTSGSVGFTSLSMDSSTRVRANAPIRPRVTPNAASLKPRPRTILATSRFCEDNWMMVIVGIILVIGALVTYKRTDRGGWQFDWLMLHLPVFGPLFRKVGLSRFSKTCATMIKSGVPILGTLEIVADTAGNRLIAEAVERARESVRQGESLMVPLSESPVFPPMVTRMIGIGEKTGSLETLLEKISEFYDEQVSATVKQLTSLIEPLMIAVMGVLVGTSVLAVFLPIFELQKNLAAH